ncbi:hypothetical protein ALC62_10412 [Cyphomyrmex costatus]|uniref:Uncharacterized protein n=1 Tax=Cyphomyrmex costatus TaxID=456900 RepID=A0A151IDT5_9HYME|nr:hypothetical protein ALC62_10412 [Cyphomyrmex costatus]
MISPRMPHHEKEVNMKKRVRGEEAPQNVMAQFTRSRAIAVDCRRRSRVVDLSERQKSSFSIAGKREYALILLRADRAYTATNCDEASNGIKRLEKNGPFGNALDTEIDDTIHFEISPVQLPSQTMVEYRNGGSSIASVVAGSKPTRSWDKPQFDDIAPRNITAIVGQTAELNCYVKHPGDRVKKQIGIAKVVTPDCTFSVVVNEPIKRNRPSGCQESIGLPVTMSMIYMSHSMHIAGTNVSERDKIFQMAPGEILRGINWDNGASDLRRIARKSVSVPPMSTAPAAFRDNISHLENVTESAAMHIQRNRTLMKGTDCSWDVKCTLPRGELAVNWEERRDETRST